MIYEFCAEDSIQEWLFFHENNRQVLVPRDEYVDLACTACGKIDEFEAIKRGLPVLELDTDFDVVLSGEDWLCVSSRFVELYAHLGAQGLDFIPISDEFFAVLCTNLIAVAPQMAGFKESNKCKACDRFRERIVGPMAASFGQIDLRESFFTSKVPNENVRAVHQRIFISETMSYAFQSSSLPGMCFVEW